ncbi:MAG: indolepyruvate oxidoreductase subunit beta [Rickettsiales bacterium]|nr:indolepyruvate oxidoreductase subunit beta [Rickettsiales bacterium]
MKYDIVLCGVGGQGIVLVSNLLIKVAEKSGLNVKQSEIHGMAQRGGAVSALIRINDEEVHSPIISKGQADIIISMEPLEIFRYLDFANSETKLIVSGEPFNNISNYPELSVILSNLKKLNAYVIDKADNIMLAGATSNAMNIKFEVFEESLKELFTKKSEDVLMKVLAELKNGKEIGEKLGIK